MTENSVVCRISPLRDLDSLAHDWARLESRSTPSIFLTWDWIGLWLRSLSSKLYVAEMTMEDRIVGLSIIGCADRYKGPVKFRTLFLNQSGDPEEDRIYVEYNNILCESRHEDEVWRALFHSLTVERGNLPKPLQNWSQLRLAGIQTRAPLPGRDFGLLTLRHRTGESFIVDLEAIRQKQQGFVANLSANSRQQLKRSQRLLGETGSIAVDFSNSADEAVNWFEDMVNLQTEWFIRRGKAAALSRPFFRNFLKNFLDRGLAVGRADFVRISVDGKPLGYLVNMICNGRVMNYQSAFRHYDDNRVKPGLVSHALLVDHYRAAGYDRYDFLAGADRYKISLSNTTETLEWQTLAPPNLKSALFRLADTGMGRIRSFLPGGRDVTAGDS